MGLNGWLHPDFAPLAESFGREVAAYPGGAGLCVYRGEQCVVDLWGGVRDAAGRPWLRETLAPSFSTTKGVASTLVHIAVDRGLLDYDAPVSRYWPEFGAAGKSAITLRQVLSHQAGLYSIRQMIDDAGRMLDWEHMVRAIERARPVHPPGERTGYHGLTYGFIVGEILQRVTGKPFSKLVREELALPLGLEGCFVGAPPEAISRTADLLWPTRGLLGPGPLGDVSRSVLKLVSGGLEHLQPFVNLAGIPLDLNGLRDALAPPGIQNFDFGAPETLAASIPAANGVFDARSLARMYAALGRGGELDGVRILSRETVAAATELQEPTRSRVVIPFDMRWRLGYHGAFTSRGRLPGAFGHFGFGGSGAWAHPESGMALALVANSGLGTPFGDFRIARLGAAAVSCRPEESSGAEPVAVDEVLGRAPSAHTG